MQKFEIPPATIVQSRNDPSWQVRLKNGVKESLHTAFRKAMPNETGGLLIGRINQKAKIIYVTNLLNAPSDSVSSPCAFKMGVDDIPQEINKVDELTGGMLGYVGEWHTHPNGETRLSSIDENTVKVIKKHLDCIPLPTHVMIVTKNGLHPYIFSSK
jgi:integrative and conjugative element protein (TIGR02256 family)